MQINLSRFQCEQMRSSLLYQETCQDMQRLMKPQDEVSKNRVKKGIRCKCWEIYIASQGNVIVVLLHQYVINVQSLAPQLHIIIFHFYIINITHPQLSELFNFKSLTNPMYYKDQTISDKFDMSWIQKQTKCWVYLPNQHQNDIYVKGFIKGIILSALNLGNSRVSGLLENGSSFQSKANLIEKCRASNSIQKDLIDMDIINAPEVLNQLKRHLNDKKIYILLWNSLIIVNPFKLIPEQYSEKMISHYFQHIFQKNEDVRKYQPHIYSFIFGILKQIKTSDKIQMVSISGESGSGKTQTNKHALKAISHCCSKIQGLSSIGSVNHLENKILLCDPILQVFGNSKTIKNDNSSRFGKLITISLDCEKMKIYHTSIKNFFLQKSRIISQSQEERNFHIFYLFLNFTTDQQKSLYKLKARNGSTYHVDQFNYLTQRSTYDKSMHSSDKQMWQNLNQAFQKLDFSKETISQIWSIVAATLLVGNVQFDGRNQSQKEPCQIVNRQVVENVADLIGIQRSQLLEGMVINKRMIAGELIQTPLSLKQCLQARDSMAKAMYEGLFLWLGEELNHQLNLHPSLQQNIRHIKLLDIYGFQVFDNNSFQQLCVNYTNQKIHQIYLEQVFIHEKNMLKKEGLESMIAKLTFTDNIKIIQILDSLNKSIFNLLDQSCTLNVKDDDFLSNVKKYHEHHEKFPSSNSVNIRKSFIIKHTPGDIEYMAEGFRDKNKDLIREDIVIKLSLSKCKIISHTFMEKKQMLKVQANKKFLGIKIRKQVKQLIYEMSTNTHLHFIRCIKPNQKKLPFIFVQRVCYNQIKYLGILDTIQMRKDSYHIRTFYRQFYLKYGILEDNIPTLIKIAQGKLNNQDIKDITMRFVNNKFINHNLQYLFGKERIFLKMQTQSFLDTLLAKSVKNIQYASTIIKVHYKRNKMNKRRIQMINGALKVQRAVKDYIRKIKIIRRKKAVKVIQNYWIKYSDQYFMRKKRNPLIILQKYIKRSKQMFIINKKIQLTRKCKSFLRSMIKTNILSNRFDTFKLFKKDFLNNIFPKIWVGIKDHYQKNVQKYIKGFYTKQKNTIIIHRAEQIAQYRLHIKCRKYMQTYIKGFLTYKTYNKKNNSILLIQSYFRMFKLQRQYANLRNMTIKIQRNWKKYHYDKAYNMKFTQHYFTKTHAKYAIQNETREWKTLLFREYQKGAKQKVKGIQKLLFQQQKLKADKIYLFYYLLDFQILCNLNPIYPNGTWIDNYLNAFQQAWQKGNPIQVVDVSDQHTVCATINKVYKWGDIKFQELYHKELPYKTFHKIETIHLQSNGRIEKVHAHNQFTVIEVQNEQNIVIGNRRLYEQDGSKECKTLKTAYIIINGRIVTLQGACLVKVHLPQKIVQLSCGMSHCIAKTSLKKIYTWGDNSKGQLGHGHYKRIRKPKLVQYPVKHCLVVYQVCASAYGSMLLESNSRVYWWGTNGTIQYQPYPKQCNLFEKSELIDNPNKYTVVRLLPRWSKSLSLIGVTLAAHEGIFKSSQNNIKRKTYEHFISKWNDDISTITPPFIQSVSGYFQERFMPKSKQINDNKIQHLEHQRIKDRLLAEIIVMEQAQRDLLKSKNRY